MTGPSLLSLVLEANARFAEGKEGAPINPGTPVTVVTCIDPRLNGMLDRALGISSEWLVYIRSAGNRITPASVDVLRSIAVAAYVKGSQEILVVGHSDCALSRLETASVIDGFRKAGIPRSAFGEGDLRTWFGAFRDTKGNLIEGIETIRSSELVPKTMKIHGLLLSLDSGVLEVVLNGDQVRPEEMTGPNEAPSPAAVTKEAQGSREVPATAPVVAPPLPPKAPKPGPVVIESPVQIPAPDAPMTLMEAAKVMREFFQKEKKNRRLQRYVASLLLHMKQSGSPAPIVRELDKLMHEFKDQYPELPSAFAVFHRALATQGSAATGILGLLRRIME